MATCRLMPLPSGVRNGPLSQLGPVEAEIGEALLGPVVKDLEADEVAPEGEAPGDVGDDEFGDEDGRGYGFAVRQRCR